ncbi:MAG: hypothetical protein PHR30_00155 [Gallionellaceae bacterium]|nr:hypothetical protein [Gallionellaceae bacterium]
MSHDWLVLMWPDDLPRAAEPLWQVAQVPAATPAWFIVAGVHALVRWQVSHAAVVAMWLADFPVAL